MGSSDLVNKMRRLIITLLVLATLLPYATPAKTAGSAIVGKLVPAILKCFGGKVIGVDMNKVAHIMEKAGRGFDALDPAEIVYEAFKVAANQFGIGGVKLVLTSGKIIYVTVKVVASGVNGMGTAYFIERTAEAISDAC